ncbi:MAG: hypothetical protein ACJ789_00120 [Thermomicrobiales bacterium]
MTIDDSSSAEHDAGRESAGGQNRSALIYCGLCGALNPSTNFYCAACGTTLVDAFHATEGLRVFERPDAASRLIEIVPAGSELDAIEDANAPADYVRVRLPQGRLGYVRLSDVEVIVGAESSAVDPNAPNINTNARGCVTPTGALGALVLLVLLSTLTFYMLSRTDRADTGVLALVFCFAIGPVLLVTIGLYIYARDREERLEAETDE